VKRKLTSQFAAASGLDDNELDISNKHVVELNWIYWQTANEGRPRPEEIIGNTKINTKEKWRTYTEIKQH